MNKKLKKEINKALPKPKMFNKAEYCVLKDLKLFEIGPGQLKFIIVGEMENDFLISDRADRSFFIKKNKVTIL